MTAARYCGLKPLRRAQFHACWTWRYRQRDVACDCYIARGGFRGISVARRGDLYGRRRRQIRWRGVDACERDGSDAGVSSGNAIHAPTHACICRIHHRGGECHLISEHDRAARRRHADGNRRRRRGRRGDCAPSTAAQRPRCRRKKREEARSLPAKKFRDDVRKGPHALQQSRRRASEKTERIRGWVLGIGKMNFQPKPMRNERLTACRGSSSA